MEKASKWYVDKILVIPLSNVNLLFPFLVITNHECSNSFVDQEIDNSSRGHMQVVVNLACTLVGEALQAIRSIPLRIHPSQLALQIGPTLVIELVHRLDWTPVNKARHEAAFV